MTHDVVCGYLWLWNNCRQPTLPNNSLTTLTHDLATEVTKPAQTSAVNLGHPTAVQQHNKKNDLATKVTKPASSQTQKLSNHEDQTTAGNLWNQATVHSTPASLGNWTDQSSKQCKAQVITTTGRTNTDQHHALTQCSGLWKAVTSTSMLCHHWTAKPFTAVISIVTQSLTQQPNQRTHQEIQQMVWT